VRADADKLRQVFSNIIDNAIDAMESTKGERRLEFAIQNNGEGMAAVRIRDNGCGIAEDKIAKIYNPFYTSKSNGTGLGLGVAKKVIDAHRGTIQVLSKVGGGTEFVLSIPLSDSMRDAEGNVSDDDSENVEQPENGYAPTQTPPPSAVTESIKPSQIMTAPISLPAGDTSRLRN
jgi:signal transduction histidine kinase